MGKESSVVKRPGREQFYIRDMRETDLDEVIEIEKLTFASPWTRNMFFIELKDPRRSHFLVAEIDKQIIGYGGFSFVLDEAHISNLAVHQDYRRKKIGENILKTILTSAVSKDIKEIFLDVRAGNLPAQNLYKKFGFRITGRRRGYYQDTREDALLMSLHTKNPC